MTKSAKQCTSLNKENRSIRHRKRADQLSLLQLKKHLVDVKARMADLESRVHELEACLTKQKDELFKCSICLNDDKSYVLQCGHCFCDSCITGILRSEYTRLRFIVTTNDAFKRIHEAKCPMCRDRITSKQRIYLC